MSVKISRDTGWIGMASGFQLYVNGEKAAKIKNKETLQLDFPDKEATIQASQWGVKTNERVVESGDELELVTTSQANRIFLLLILFMFLVQLLPNAVLGWLLILIGLVAFSVYFYVMDGAFFKLIERDALDKTSRIGTK